MVNDKLEGTQKETVVIT